MRKRGFPYITMSTNKRTFRWKDQHAFARVSCDMNPIHMDTTAARRTHAGEPIVHGMHSLLWILDVLARTDAEVSRAKNLKVQFLQPVYVGDEVILEFSRPASGSIRARLRVGIEEVLIASLGYDEAKQVLLPMRAEPHLPMPPPTSPQEPSLDAMEAQSGRLAYGSMTHQIGDMFPFATKVFGTERIAALGSCSCLVGMVVPGLHSMFSGLEVSFSENRSSSLDGIEFTVLSVAPRFRLVRIGVQSRGLCGYLETISRLPPVRQPSLHQVMRSVRSDEFRGSTALVIGGSRGLGELTSKLIAAGGGHVVLTYATGKADADSVVAEMEGAGLSAAASSYDVRAPAASQIAKFSEIPTHVYYFATPPIFRRKAGHFDHQRFSEFNLFYLNGFFDLIQACAQSIPQGIRAFYPSSAAIDTRPATMTEYTMSKAAGEVLCADLARLYPGVSILTSRLPRLPTDQTSSVVQAGTSDPVEVMLPIVRDMHHGRVFEVSRA